MYGADYLLREDFESVERLAAGPESHPPDPRKAQEKATSHVGREWLNRAVRTRQMAVYNGMRGRVQSFALMVSAVLVPALLMGN